MKPDMNIVLQIMAVLVALTLRLIHPGWMVVIAVLTVVPLIVGALPLVLALRTARRRSRLQPSVAAAFVATAVTLVALAALYPEMDDRTEWMPLTEVLGLPGPEYLTAYTAGNAALLAYLASLVWTGIALGTTRSARSMPTGSAPTRA